MTLEMQEINIFRSQVSLFFEQRKKLTSSAEEELVVLFLFFLGDRCCDFLKHLVYTLIITGLRFNHLNVITTVVLKQT